MTLVTEYRAAQHEAELARLHRIMAVRAMMTQGQSQREIARQLGLTQPAISYQCARQHTDECRPSLLIKAGGSVLRHVAEDHGFTELAAFGSAARGDDRADSDVDLLAYPPAHADTFDMIRLEEAFEVILGKDVDLVSYRGLDPRIDSDILRDKVLL